jgi:thioredoxin-related protein
VKINPCLKKIVAAIGETPMVLVSDSRKKTGKQYGVEGIPHMVIIDRTGKVTAVHIGYGEGQLPRLIKEINEIAQR